MREDDIAAVDAIMAAAYARPQDMTERLRASLRQRDARSWVAEADGRVAGAVFGNDYGRSAYVASMGVEPSYQGQGIATRLMRELLAWSDARGFRDVRLDASEAGAPLYERFGFVDVCETLVLEAAVVRLAAEDGAGAEDDADAENAHSRLGHLAAILALDRAAFDADRTPVLEQLVTAAARVLVVPRLGYALTRRGARGTIVGPWIAADAPTARSLLARALRGCTGPATLFVPSVNDDALDIAAEAGFVCMRRLRHMIRGVPIVPSPQLYGRVSLGQG